MDERSGNGRQLRVAPFHQRRLFAVSPLAGGFTLVELIVTIIILGIMAAAVIPRFANQDAFEQRGFRDETVSLLRWAQKSAVAQRRAVCVVPHANGVALTIAATAGDTAACNTALALPNNPRGGSGLASSVAGFRFLASGNTDQTGNVTLTIAGVTVTVEAITGYVH